jgi:hypothetical protein
MQDMVSQSVSHANHKAINNHACIILSCFWNLRLNMVVFQCRMCDVRWSFSCFTGFVRSPQAPISVDAAVPTHLSKSCAGTILIKRDFQMSQSFNLLFFIHFLHSHEKIFFLRLF